MPHDGITIDLPRKTVRIARTYAANVNRVWWAWTDATAITQWWGPAGWAATVYEMDVRPGGCWRFEIEPEDGSAEPVRGVATYNRVIPHAELAYDDAFADEAWQADSTGTFPTTVRFTSFSASCHVQVEVRFPNVDVLRRAVELQMAQGYAETLKRLGDLLDLPHARYDRRDRHFLSQDITINDAAATNVAGCSRAGSSGL